MSLRTLRQRLPLGVVILLAFCLAGWSLVDRNSDLSQLERELTAALACRGGATQQVLLLLSGRAWDFDKLTSCNARLRDITHGLAQRETVRQDALAREAIAGLAEDPERIERFKTDLSAYRRSVQAANDLVREVAPLLVESPAFVQQVAKAASTRSMVAIEEWDAEIEGLQARTEDDSPEAAKLDLLGKHLRLVAERAGAIDRVLSELLDPATPRSIGELLVATQARQIDGARAVQNREKLALLLLAFAIAYVVALAIESQRAAKKLEALNNGLEDRVAERTDALNQESDLLGSIISGLPNAVFWKDNAGVYQGCNRAFAEFVSAADPADVIGKTDHDLAWDDETCRSKLQKEKRVVDERSPLTNEHVKKALRDGRVFDVIASKTILTDGTGEARGLVGIYTDVTELNQLRDQVQQADKLQAVGRLAAGIAHEINTPIQTAASNIEFLRDAVGKLLTLADSNADGGDRSASESPAPGSPGWLRLHAPGAVEDSDCALQRVTEIVQAMRVMSHPGADGKAPADLNQLVRSAATLTRNRWKYCAKLEIDLDDALPEVECNASEVSQVLLNLIVNAGDAIAETREGAAGLGRIDVRTRVGEGGVLIEVADDGAGIPEEIRSKVFEPFFTTKDVGSGTGQGLAIAYDVVVVKHGGTIDYETTTGVGTTFRIRLPIRATDNRRATTPDQAAVPA